MVVDKAIEIGRCWNKFEHRVSQFHWSMWGWMTRWQGYDKVMVHWFMVGASVFVDVCCRSFCKETGFPRITAGREQTSELLHGQCQWPRFACVFTTGSACILGALCSLKAARAARGYWKCLFDCLTCNVEDCSRHPEFEFEYPTSRLRLRFHLGFTLTLSWSFLVLQIHTWSHWSSTSPCKLFLGLQCFLLHTRAISFW